MAHLLACWTLAQYRSRLANDCMGDSCLEQSFFSLAVSAGVFPSLAVSAGVFPLTASSQHDQARTQVISPRSSYVSYLAYVSYATYVSYVSYNTYESYVAYVSYVSHRLKLSFMAQVRLNTCTRQRANNRSMPHVKAMFLLGNARC